MPAAGDGYPGGHANLEVRSDVGGYVEVSMSRSLCQDGEGWDETDPSLFITIHVTAKGEQKRETLSSVRWSDLGPMIRALRQVEQLAKWYRLMPPALDMREKYQQVYSPLPSPPTEETPPSPEPRGTADDWDAGDIWKRGTLYDHTRPPDEE